jgi:hypothetical protein
MVPPRPISRLCFTALVGYLTRKRYRRGVTRVEESILTYPKCLFYLAS